MVTVTSLGSVKVVSLSSMETFRLSSVARADTNRPRVSASITARQRISRFFIMIVFRQPKRRPSSFRACTGMASVDPHPPYGWIQAVYPIVLANRLTCQADRPFHM